MLGRLVDYGSDDEDLPPPQPSEAAPSGPNGSQGESTIDSTQSHAVSKKREAQSDLPLPPAKMPKLNPSDDDDLKPDAAMLAQRNAKTLMSVLPKPKSAAHTAPEASGDSESTDNTSNIHKPISKLSNDTSPRKPTRAVAHDEKSLQQPSEDSDPSSGVLPKKPAASPKARPQLPVTTAVVGPSKPAQEDDYGYGYAVVQEDSSPQWAANAYAAYGYPMPYGAPAPMYGMPGYPPMTMPAYGMPQVPQAPNAAWARDMERMGASFVDIDAKKLHNEDREAYVAQAEATGGLGPPVTKMFSKTARSRHQLSAMAAQAKEQEKQLAAKKAAGLKTKAETRAKYGW